MLNVKMKYIQKWTDMRRKNAKLYTETFASMGIEEVVTPWHPDYVDPVYHLYIIRVKNREKLIEHLNKNGVQNGLHYPLPLQMQKAYAHLGYKPEDFPVAKKYAEEILSIPMYPEMTEEMINYVCSTIKKFYS